MTRWIIISYPQTLRSRLPNSSGFGKGSHLPRWSLNRNYGRNQKESRRRHHTQHWGRHKRERESTQFTKDIAAPRQKIPLHSTSWTPKKDIMVNEDGFSTQLRQHKQVLLDAWICLPRKKDGSERRIAFHEIHTPSSNVIHVSLSHHIRYGTVSFYYTLEKVDGWQSNLARLIYQVPAVDLMLFWACDNPNP